MLAKDVMSTDVVTVTPDTAVIDIAKLLLERRISAVPVVDPENRILGIVSEGDLIHRPELGVKRRRPSWWLSLLAEDQELSVEYLKTHGSRAAQVMTTPVVTVAEDTPIGEIAELLEERRIKRVPVVRDGRLVGIVARSNLLRGLVAYKETLPTAPSMDDQAIQDALLKSLEQDGAPHAYANVIVTDGVVHLWGLVQSEQERQAMCLAAESTPGVRAVEDHLTRIDPRRLTSGG